MTHEIHLRDVNVEDLPIFFEHQLDLDAVHLAAHPPRDSDAFHAHWMELLDKTSVIKKTICFDDLVAGYIISFVYFGVREVGYWIGKEYWGQGIATKALSQFLDQVRCVPVRRNIIGAQSGCWRNVDSGWWVKRKSSPLLTET